MNIKFLIEKLQLLANARGDVEVRLQDDGEYKFYGILDVPKFDGENNMVIVTIDTFGELE